MQSLRDKNRRPTHPGEILREDVLPAIRMTKTEFAKRLGVSRPIIFAILNEQGPVTPDVAIRLSRLVGSTPQFWLRLQHTVDIWEVEHNKSTKNGKRNKIKRFKEPKMRPAV